VSLLHLIPGWALGVLINLAADGLPRGGWLRRPVCQACGAPRPPAAWPALPAWFLRIHRCAYCGVPRPARAPIVEAASALGWLALARARPDPPALAPALLISAVFLLVIVIDVEHRLIPHALTLPAAVAIGLVGALDPARGPVKTLLGGAAGFAFFLLLYYLGGAFARAAARLRGRALEEVAFGFGDVTLAGVIGLAVGWPGVLVALFLGILAAGAFSLAFLLGMLVRRRYTAFVPIPYGPFLVLGGWAVYLGGREVFARLLGG
jgi:leader peptidase (prepilin peptidase)/N-methyltransferase